jgi:hypothetical protein
VASSFFNLNDVAEARKRRVKRLAFPDDISFYFTMYEREINGRGMPFSWLYAKSYV